MTDIKDLSRLAPTESDQRATVPNRPSCLSICIRSEPALGRGVVGACVVVGYVAFVLGRTPIGCRDAAVHTRVGSGSASSPPVLTALTGIRAVGAVLVLGYHLRNLVFVQLPATREYEALFAAGTLGLDMFFILSGFIISYNYAERLANLAVSRYRGFMLARFARIYPVFLASLVLTALLVILWQLKWKTPFDPTQNHTVLGFIGNVLMLQGLPGVEAWNGPSWSVSCETFAYLLFPFLAGMLLKLSRVQALVLAAGVVVLQLSIHAAIGPIVYPPLADRWTRIAGEFTLGCLLWAAWRYGVRAHWRWDLLGLSAAVGMVAVAFWARSTGADLIVEPFAVMVALPFMAIFVVSTASATGPLRAFLASRPMEWGGRMSYSFYLTHMPVLSVLLVFMPPERTASAPLATRLAVVAVYLIVVLSVAAASYYVVEEPGRRWIRRRSSRSRAADRTPIVSKPSSAPPLSAAPD